MKTEPETSAEYNAFKALLNRILAVPRAKLIEREEEYQFHSALNPSRPGPKRGMGRGVKKKPSSRVPGVEPPA